MATLCTSIMESQPTGRPNFFEKCQLCNKKLTTTEALVNHATRCRDRVKIVRFPNLFDIHSMPERVNILTAHRLTFDLPKKTQESLLGAYLMYTERKAEIPKHYPLKYLESCFEKTIGIPTYCVTCGKTRRETRLHKCTECCFVYYCSEICQVSDWKNHRESICDPIMSPLAEVRTRSPKGTIIVKAVTKDYKYVTLIYPTKRIPIKKHHHYLYP